MNYFKRNYQGPFKKTPARLFGLGLILLYQNSLGLFIGQHCCYTPSCSEYGYEAIARHGLWAGAFLTFFRIFRCHPWAQCGFDPVPKILPKYVLWYKPWRYKKNLYILYDKSTNNT